MWGNFVCIFKMASCFINIIIEDNFWLLLGFLFCLLHFVRHWDTVVCFCTSISIGEVHTWFSWLSLSMMPCLQMWLFRITSQDVRFETFTVVKIQVKVFWFMTPCSVAVGYQCFGGQVERADSSEMLVQYPAVSRPRRHWLESLKSLCHLAVSF